MIGSTERLKRWKDVKKDDASLPVIAEFLQFGYENAPGRSASDRVFFDSFRPFPARRLCLEPAEKQSCRSPENSESTGFFRGCS